MSNHKIREINGNLEGVQAVELYLSRGGQLVKVPCVDLTNDEFKERKAQIMEQVKGHADWDACVETVQIKCNGKLFRGVFAYADDEPQPTPSMDN